MRRINNGDDVADVLAETFLTVWRRLDDVPPGDRTRPWLYGVARRVLANHHRGERRRNALGDRLRTELAETNWGGGIPADLGDVTDTFRSLSDGDQELLSLVAWEDLDTGQIAIVLGCSRNAVRVRLHRARKRFVSRLERCPTPSGTLLALVRDAKGDAA
jgi:DNA-directed RNA polymerase specialized sigma24 family protein